MRIKCRARIGTLQDDRAVERRKDHAWEQTVPFCRDIYVLEYIILEFHAYV